jgi:hypothetical protein
MGGDVYVVTGFGWGRKRTRGQGGGRLLLIEFGPRKSGDMGVVMDRQNGGYENGGINTSND